MLKLKGLIGNLQARSLETRFKRFFRGIRGLLWRDGEAKHSTSFQLQPLLFYLFYALSLLVKCHLMKEFCGQKKKKKKSFGNCWPSLSSLILKMVKQRHREGKSPSKISCHLATGSALSPRSSLVLLEDGGRASLVAQWLRICLLMQGTRVRALVWEDPTCHGAAGPMSHSY